jgi:maltose O-acetyltransferase
MTTVGSLTGREKAEPVNRFRRVRKMMREDARTIRQDVLVNAVAGSVLVPRLFRYAIFRLLGMRVHGIVLPGCVIVGRLQNLSIGPDSSLGRRGFLEATGPISIGAGSAIGPDVLIATSHHPIQPGGSWQPAAVPEPVVIGDRVWIGARVTICPGAVIESDVVVAAGAVVVGRLESGAVYGGVPARRIGTTTITPANPSP